MKGCEVFWLTHKILDMKSHAPTSFVAFTSASASNAVQVQACANKMSLLHCYIYARSTMSGVQLSRLNRARAPAS